MLAVRTIKRIGWVVAGFVILLAGLAMTVLPGPAIVFIPLGLGILGSEFLIVRRMTRQARDKIPTRSWKRPWLRKFMRTTRYWLNRSLRFMSRRSRASRR